MSLRLLNPPHPLTFPTISPNPPPGYEPEVEFTKLSDAKAENWLAAAFWILGIYYGFIAKPRPKPYEPFSNRGGRKYPYRNNPVPPPSVAAAAKRGLELRSQVAPSKRGGTSVGLARARQLARRQNISEQTIKRMRSFFARHEVDKKAKGFRKGEKGYPSKGLQAWLLWGGDSGKAWANKFRR
jgi:hypothetical protein